jgi:hypothetical protein
VIIFALIAIAVILAVTRVWTPWRPRATGGTILVLRMPLRVRVRNQAIPLLILGVAAGANAIFEIAASWVPLVPLAILVVGLLVPARYTITTDGVMVGSVAFRRWTEFSGVTIRRGRVRCKSISGMRRLDIWLPGRFHDADTVAEIRRLIRDAYQGRAVTTTDAQEAVESDASLVTI